jgi:prepilin signal peptidase PulO-like enzyme (type II secretory pathway)
MRSYIPFGPFLVAGAVLTMLLDERVLSLAR